MAPSSTSPQIYYESGPAPGLGLLFPTTVAPFASSSKRPMRRDGPSQPSTPADLLRLSLDKSLDWNAWRTSRVEPFIHNRVAKSPTSPNTLEIDWPTFSKSKGRGDMAAKHILQTLFHFLSIHLDHRCPLATFTKMSIHVPEEVHDSVRIAPEEKDMVDLLHASHVRELYWEGDFLFLNMSFCNLPSDSLRVLSLAMCNISVMDALGVLNECPNLEALTIETITSTDKEIVHSDAIRNRRQVVLLKLKTIRIKSTIHIDGFLKQLKIPSRGIKSDFECPPMDAEIEMEMTAQF
ncbi:hypothetical protein GALMADRAFT_258144 [Galerina marginata CBS 339.88]|uniref:F-box domain-containing protein n=1 Tax=Galerina marginata (strain CBS 339.88) TaxID=685588 RepID=A0A067S9K4_GALM3|nr:hypothetical protein GALMADRAFT_258144 [Galerina marginata CBS 339.88]